MKKLFIIHGMCLLFISGNFSLDDGTHNFEGQGTTPL